MSETHEVEAQDLHKRIAAVRDAGIPWFHVELAIPFDEAERKDVEQLLISLENILGLALENLDEQIHKPMVVTPSIVLPPGMQS